MPPKFPVIVPMSTIRRLWPSPRRCQELLAANPGCILGVVSKTGAMAKTVTLTRLGTEFHKVTKKPAVTRKDILLDDALEETMPSDLVLARPVGLISVKKRHAFYQLVKRQGTARDGERTVAIEAVERARLDEVEGRRRDRLDRIREEAEQGVVV